MENLGNILFVIAGCLWGIELIPQLIRTFKTKSVKDFSPFFLTLCFIAYIFFMAGCILIKNWYLLFSHIVPSINIVILCVLYWVYRDKKIQHFPPDSAAQAAYIEKECSGECDTCQYNKGKK